MPEYLLPPTLRDALPAKARALADQVRIHAVLSAQDPWFDVAYALLDAYFGPRGEFEARDDLARLVAAPFEHRGIHVACPLLVCVGSTGEVVAASTRYVTYEPATGVLAYLDGCTFTVEAQRGHGSSALALAILLDHGRRLLAPFGAGAATRTLDVGDLEPLDPTDPDAVQRAVVWGRAGGVVIPPDAFPLTLVGMRDDATPGGELPPVPVLAMVRDPSRPGPLPTLDKAALDALARHLEAAHAWSGDATVLTGETARLRAAVAAFPADPVPLAPLPTARDDHAAIERLYALSRPLLRERTG